MAKPREFFYAVEFRRLKMPIRDIIEKLRRSVNDPDFGSVTDWKTKHPGSKAIGCFPVYAPVELIHAAGMLPVTVAGASGGVRLDRANSILQAFVCSIARSTLELELEGKLKALDGMVFPSVCEVARGLSGVWARSVPDKPVFYIHFPQNLRSSGTLDYLASELSRFKSALEELGGRRISDDALNESFRVYNKRADLLNALDLLRRDCPQCLKASEFYILRLAGNAVSPEDHIEILEKAMEAVDKDAAAEKPMFRMALTGAFCELPPLAMLETIEDTGVAIVSDDIQLGMRWWAKPIPESDDPVRTLAEHYLNSAVRSSIVHENPKERCEEIRERIAWAHADGVIYASPKFCHPSLHDAACIVKTCEERGIPYIRFEYEEDMAVFESICVQVEALLEARAALPFAGTENHRKKPGKR